MNLLHNLIHKQLKEKFFSRLPAHFSHTLIVYLILPMLFYFGLFVVLSYPLITFFNTGVMSSSLDSLQNIWNLWWFTQAATSSNIQFWQTYMLFYPFGVSLYAHALTPINGFLGWVLQVFVPLVQTYNVLVILGFVLSGYSMFLLAWYLIRSYFPALMAGFWFTFSAYHWSQGRSHLEMHSVQWLIFFILTWVIFLKRPNFKRALLSALVLRLVLWNTPYHFLYGVVMALILLAGNLFQKRPVLASLKKVTIPLVVFMLTVILTTYSQLNALVTLSHTDPFSDSHIAIDYSLDLLGYFIPGHNVRFNQFAEGFWKGLPGGPHEAAHFLGWTVIGLTVYALSQKRSPKIYLHAAWLLVIVAFTLFALGPLPQVWGYARYIMLDARHFLTLPYDWLDRIFPFISLSGLPSRSVVVVVATSSLLAAKGLHLLVVKKRYLLVGLITLVAVFERLPSSWPLIDVSVPSYVMHLKNLPEGGLLDLANDSSRKNVNDAYAMYYQTIHHQPLVNGYVSRVPSRIYNASIKAHELWKQRNYWTLCRTYHVRYVSTKEDIGPKPGNPSLVFSDSTIRLYDLSQIPDCAERKTGGNF